MTVGKNQGVPTRYNVKGKGPASIFRTGAGGDGRMWKLAGYVAHCRNSGRP